jgi:hypothetical protein
MRSFEFREHQFYFQVLCLMFLLGIFPRWLTLFFKEPKRSLKNQQGLIPGLDFRARVAIEPQQAEFVAFPCKIQKAFHTPGIAK